MVNEALIQLEQDRDRWMDVFLDISPQSIRIVDKDVSGRGMYLTVGVACTLFSLFL